MQDFKVKGTLLTDFVKMIRKNKDKNWEKYLTPKDWEIINSKIAASSWYPIELYNRFGLAAFDVIAGMDYKKARSTGEEMGTKLFTGIYGSVVTPNSPMMSLKKFVNIYTMFFNFSPLKMEAVGDTRAKLQYDYAAESREGNNAFTHLLSGILDTLMKMSGAKNIKIAVPQKQWENAPATVLEVQWA